jgi:hypothetical protein
MTRIKKWNGILQVELPALPVARNDLKIESRQGGEAIPVTPIFCDTVMNS